MERFTFLSSLTVHWRGILASFSSGILCALTVFLLAGTSHTATSTYLLIPPIQRVQQASAAGYAPPNPLLYLGSLTQARDALIRAVATKDVADDLANRHESAALTVEPDATSSGPLIVVQVAASDREESILAVRHAGTLLSTKLKVIQDRLAVNVGARITSLELTETPQANSTNRTAIRGAAFSGVVVTALGLILVAMLYRRSASRILSSSAEESS